MQPMDELLRQQESLRAVIEAISSELELRPLLTAIVRYACELLNADRGTIGLLDAQRRVIRTEAVFNMPPGELGAEMPPGKGLAGLVLELRQPVIFQSYGAIPNPTQRDLFGDAVIGVPIWWRGDMIGFFGLGALPPRAFHEQDTDKLTVFARHAAIAIENARLFEAEKRRGARIVTINRIGQLITSSLERQQILETAVEALSEHLALHNVSLFLVDPSDPQSLTLAARSSVRTSPAHTAYRQSIAEGVVGAAARTRQRLLIPDVQADPRYIPIPGADAVRSELAVPIVVGDHLLGVLNIESELRIREEDAEEIQIVADQLSVAIENAHLFGDTQRALDELKLLYETSQRISIAMDVDQVIEAYLDQLAARGRYRCSVVLYEFDDFGSRTATVVRGRWSPDGGVVVRLGERFPYARDALDRPLEGGHTIAISDVDADPRVTNVLRDLQRRDGRPALAMIPLIVRRQRIGLVILSYQHVHEWTEAELRPYQVTAAQLAAAIDSRQQQEAFHRKGRQLAILEERHRLARDLHDSVNQLLFGITLIAQSLSPAWQRSFAEGEARVQRLVELSQTALAEMRALLNELRPSRPEPHEEALDPLASLARIRRHGLLAALQHYAGTHEHPGVHIAVSAQSFLDAGFGSKVRPAAGVEETIFRIAQEAISNAIKHSGAQLIDIQLEANDTAIELLVADDGSGFMPRARIDGAGDSGGLGLTTMRERAESMNGTLRVLSAPHQGTTIHVRLPRQGKLIYD